MAASATWLNKEISMQEYLFFQWGAAVEKRNNPGLERKQEAWESLETDRWQMSEGSVDRAVGRGGKTARRCRFWALMFKTETSSSRWVHLCISASCVPCNYLTLIYMQHTGSFFYLTGRNWNNLRPDLRWMLQEKKGSTECYDSNNRGKKNQQ